MILPTSLNLLISCGLLYFYHQNQTLNLLSNHATDIAGTQSKICAADSLNSIPYPYASKEDLDLYLRFPTAINMTQRFSFLVNSGYVLSILWVFFYLTYALQSSKKNEARNFARNLRWYALLTLLSSLHFYLLVYWRLYLRQGRVCGGDFSVEVVGQGAERE